MDEILDDDFFERPKNEDLKKFKFYRGFHNMEEAREFAALLESHQVPYHAKKSQLIIDSVIVGTGLMPKVTIEIKPEDFPKVNAIIEDQISAVDFADVEDHYLNQMEDEELMEIFEKPDEWTVEDVNIAKIIARERGVRVSDSEIQNARAKRLEEIRKGKSEGKTRMALYFLGMIAGVFINITIISLALILAGIGMGYYYAYGKSLDPDGNKFPAFDPDTRQFGKLIFYGGFLALMIKLLIF